MILKSLLLLGLAMASPLRSIVTETQDQQSPIQTKHGLHGFGSDTLVKATEEKLGVSISDFVLEYIRANLHHAWVRDCIENPTVCKSKINGPEKPGSAITKVTSRRAQAKQYDPLFPDYDAASEVEYHYIPRPEH